MDQLTLLPAPNLMPEYARYAVLLRTSTFHIGRALPDADKRLRSLIHFLLNQLLFVQFKIQPLIQKLT